MTISMSIPTIPAFDLQDGAMAYLPINQISVKEGFNPRKEFIESEMDSLEADVSRNGVIQPIVVRPNASNDGFWVIAGERRFRASKKIGLIDIPCIYREVSDIEAIALAKAENSERSEMGAIGEAFACREALMRSDNDAEEAAKVMGMSMQTFNKRLLLLHAEPETQRALGRRQIKLGHAELLVGLPRQAQVDTVAALIEKGNVPVADLKRSIEGFVVNLESACFDVAGCQDCPSNSTKQSSLFDEHVGESKCSNHACFGEKTLAAVAAKKVELADKFNTVHLDTERTPSSYTLVEKLKVGADQYSACLGCSSFGALMSTKAGDEGSVTKGVCFNLECHQEKVSAFQKLSTPSTKTKSVTTDSVVAQKTVAKSSATNETPKPVTAWIDEFLLNEAVNELQSGGDDPALQAKTNHVSMVLCLTHLLRSGSVMSKLPTETKSKFGLSASMSMSSIAKQLITFESSALGELRHGVAIAYLQSQAADGKDGLQTVVTILKHFSVSLSDRFTLTDKFLKGHTTAGIMSLLEENEGLPSSFAAWLEASEKGTFKKFMTQTKTVIISKILSTEFNFSGFLPRCVSQRVSTLSKGSH